MLKMPCPICGAALSVYGTHVSEIADTQGNRVASDPTDALPVNGLAALCPIPTCAIATHPIIIHNPAGLIEVFAIGEFERMKKQRPPAWRPAGRNGR